MEAVAAAVAVAGVAAEVEAAAEEQLDDLQHPMKFYMCVLCCFCTLSWRAQR
jgi:hypothetical protein